MQCELEFKKLMLQTDMNQVEPMYYTGTLILGILCTLLSLNWLGTIIFVMINYFLSIGTTTEITPPKDIVNIILTFCVD